MPIFIERYLLPALAAITIALFIINPMTLDRTQRITGILAVAFLAYFLSHTLHRYNQAAKQAPGSPIAQEEVRPSVFVKLVIDSVSPEAIVHHLQVENGPFPIKEIRVASDSDEFSGIELEALPRLLPPNKQFRINGPPAVFTGKKHSNFTVRLFFIAEINGTDHNFVVTSRFIVRPEDMKPQTIEPEFRTEEERAFTAEDAKKELQASLREQLVLSEGTIGFAVGEINEGKPNVVRFGNEQKEFVFDPVSKIATFKIKTESGRLVNLSQTFEERKTGKHVILLAWDSTGGLLGVDGLETKDMPSEKQNKKSLPGK